jgi:hypothetical protein
LAYHDANIFYLQSIAATAQVFLTSNAERARIRADGLFEVKGAGTAGSSPAFSVNGSAPANSFVLGSTGRVGIGTTSPSVSLHLDGTIANAPKLRVSRGAGNTNYIEFGTNGGDSTITANGVTGTAGALVFYRDSNTGTATESARIDSSGRLLVGTSTLPTPATDYRCVIGQNGAEGGALYLSRNLSNSQILSAGYSIGAITAGTTDGIMGKILFQSNGTGSASSSPGAIIVQVTESGNTSPTTLLQILSDRTFSLSNTCNFALGTTTGTKIGTATTQKLGFYNATPVVQPAAVADATDAASVITQLNALLARMRSLGLIAT